jgi:hypothetical protein
VRRLPAQLAIHQREQLLDRLRLSIADFCEQLR